MALRSKDFCVGSLVLLLLYYIVVDKIQLGSSTQCICGEKQMENVSPINICVRLYLFIYVRAWTQVLHYGSDQNIKRAKNLCSKKSKSHNPAYGTIICSSAKNKKKTSGEQPKAYLVHISGASVSRSVEQENGEKQRHDCKSSCKPLFKQFSLSLRDATIVEAAIVCLFHLICIYVYNYAVNLFMKKIFMHLLLLFTFLLLPLCPSLSLERLSPALHP